MVVTRCVETTLAIPDNEAATARATLTRLGIPLEALERADLYKIEVECKRESELLAALRGIETIFNPNKHRLAVRKTDRPDQGELWVEETAALESDGGTISVAGRALPGVRRLQRLVSWKLTAPGGDPASAATVARAASALLCNAAFQRAVFVR
ncbi:MAG: hypothetical protein GIW95_10070 [Candidatus Eremiobacteraeota bacterium]|nr:hypothetical protein [Candidatus Eremiobacteraeota bacterium]